MNTTREHILQTLRTRLEPQKSRNIQDCATRLRMHKRGLIPVRGQGHNLVSDFIDYARQVSASVVQLDSIHRIPESVFQFLQENHALEGNLCIATVPFLRELSWEAYPMVKIKTGPAQEQDTASLTYAIAGVAETGSVLVASTPQSPSTLNMFPENHLVVLPQDRIVGCYEDAWSFIRQQEHPRTVCLITGPSRTGDIELQIQLGAHGPCRLHILLVSESPVQ